MVLYIDGTGFTTGVDLEFREAARISLKDPESVLQDYGVV